MGQDETTPNTGRCDATRCHAPSPMVHELHTPTHAPTPVVHEIACGAVHPPTHHPLWSMNCRNSSMGGCAPYTSLAGMLRSSTNTTHLRPMGGPYTPFRRLSRRPSICTDIHTQTHRQWEGRTRPSVACPGGRQSAQTDRHRHTDSGRAVPALPPLVQAAVNLHRQTHTDTQRVGVAEAHRVAEAHTHTRKHTHTHTQAERACSCVMLAVVRAE